MNSAIEVIGVEVFSFFKGGDKYNREQWFIKNKQEIAFLIEKKDLFRATYVLKRDQHDKVSGIFRKFR